MTILCFLRPGSIISPHWLKLPLSVTNFHVYKVDRAIKVRLYAFIYFSCHDNLDKYKLSLNPPINTGK